MRGSECIKDLRRDTERRTGCCAENASEDEVGSGSEVGEGEGHDLDDGERVEPLPHQADWAEEMWRTRRSAPARSREMRHSPYSQVMERVRNRWVKISEMRVRGTEFHPRQYQLEE